MSNTPEQIKIKVNQLSEFAKEIAKKAKEISEFANVMNNKFGEIFEEIEFEETRYPRELNFTLQVYKREMGLLSIFTLLNNYEQINVSESRGITEYYVPNERNIAHLEPNGKYQAKILLWTGTEQYIDPDQHVNNFIEHKLITKKELMKKLSARTL